MQLRPVLVAASVFALGLPAAATDVIGNINTSQHWTTAGSPYRVTGDLIVAPQATLTIDPGVVVEAQSTDLAASGNNNTKVEFTVNGTLVANGTAAQPIIFRGSTTGRDVWYGIILDVNAKSSQLTNAKISDAMTALWVRAGTTQTLSDVFINTSTTGVLSQTNTAMTFDRFEISFPKTWGIRLEDNGAGGTTATVSGGFLYSGDPASAGISVANRVNATVKRNRVFQVGTGLKIESGASATVQNNVFAGDYLHGIDVTQATGANLSIVNNTIDRNTTAGINVGAVTSAPAFVVRNNLVTNNGTGLKVAGGTEPAHDTNDVWGNTTDYSGATKPPSSISTNPLYVFPVTTSAPTSGVTWISGPSFSMSGASYCSSSQNSIEVPGAAFVRLKGLSWTRGSFCTLYLYDRGGATLATYSSSFSNTTTPVALGNYYKAYEQANSCSYSCYGLGTATTEYLPHTVWNYRLTSSSPVIDRANATGAAGEDADGTTRPVDGDVDGTAKTDMGAYEFHDNYPPNVNAGADRTVKPGDTVNFDAGSTADPDGSIATYDWDFGDSSTHASTRTATHGYSAVGDYSVKLTVTDNLGASSNDTLVVHVKNNLPPTANAGNDQLNVPIGQVVTLDGSGSTDSDGTIITYDWSCTDSWTGSGRTAQHSFARAAVFTCTLKVTDNQGSFATDDVAIVVGGGGSGNRAPVANAGNSQTVNLGTAVTLSGAASTDPDGASDIASYSWDFGDGTAKGSGVSVTHTYAQAATFIATLTVTDKAGATGTASVGVTVVGPTNKAPTAKAGGPYTGVIGTAVSFDGSGSTDQDGTIASYAWDFGDGAGGTGAKPTHTYASASSFLVRLTVTDDKGATNTDSVLANVTAPANKPPVAHAGGPYAASVNAAVQFDGSTSTDQDGTIAAYAWDFGDGSNGTGARPVHTYTSANSFLVRLTVTDDKGGTASDTVLASIIAPNNRPPVANAGGPYSAAKGATILFDGTKSADPDGSLANYHWDFGDGGSADGDKVSHAYAAAGSFLVRLTVADDKGAADDDAVLATITVPGNQPPVAKAGGNRSAHVSESIVFDAAGSTDPDGSIASVTWDFGDGNTATTSRATHGYVEAGSYVVKLTVTDDKGAIGQDIALVSVGALQQGNQLPIARAGSDVKANVGQKVVFNGAGSTDPDGTIVAYQWDFGDGETAAGLSASHTYDAAGAFTVTLTVFDDKGARATSTLTATINGVPVVDMGDDRVAKVGQKLTFDASASTDDGTIATYKWSFGDGSKGEEATVQHAYADAGVYTVTLELTDDAGAKAVGKIKVTVTEETTTAAPPADSGGCGCSGPGAGMESVLGLVAMIGVLVRRRVLRA